MSEDARAHERHRTVLYLRVTRAGPGHEGEEFGHIVDVSERGLLILRNAALEPRSSWDLVVDCGREVFGKTTVRVAGQVRWCRPSVTPGHFECGVQIKAIARRDADVLRFLMSDLAFDSIE